MGQLYTVRSLECKNWSTLKVNLKSSFASLATSRYIIDPKLIIRSSESRPGSFLRWTWNWPWSLTDYLRSNIGRRPSSKKTSDQKTLNSHWQKNQPSSSSYGFARTGFRTTCKISKKFIFYFWRTKKSYVLKWSKKILYKMA